MNIARRIERAEQRVGIEDKEPVVIIVQMEHGDDAPTFDEPVEEWLTFKKVAEEARRQRLPAATFMVDPCAEYEVRHGSREGQTV